MWTPTGKTRTRSATKRRAATTQRRIRIGIAGSWIPRLLRITRNTTRSSGSRLPAPNAQLPKCRDDIGNWELVLAGESDAPSCLRWNLRCRDLRAFARGSAHRACPIAQDRLRARRAADL